MAVVYLEARPPGSEPGHRPARPVMSEHLATRRRSGSGAASHRAGRTSSEGQHRATCWWIVILVIVAVAGCAGLQNTLEQDLAYARWRGCEAGSSLAQIDRVEPSGRIWFSYYLEIEKQSILACLAQQEGPPLPQPVGTFRGKGGA